MEFKITIEQFEGPLDLMLHLIKENKLDLFDLDMNVLCDQYIAYIHDMQKMQLEVASEYLAELASLIEYKSKKLLPREKVEVEEEYEEDKRDRLVQRLIEYQKYKEATNILKIEFEQRQKRLSPPQSTLVSKWQNEMISDVLEDQSPYELMKAMNRVISRMVVLKPYETRVTVKELSIDQRVEQIQARLINRKEKISFEELCDDCTSVHMVIVSFLSILDLIHSKWLQFSIDENEVIWVMKGV